MTPLEARGELNLGRFADEAAIEAAYQAELQARPKHRERLSRARQVCLADHARQRRDQDDVVRTALQRYTPLSELEEPAVPGCVLLGGSGVPLRRGMSYDVHFTREAVECRALEVQDGTYVRIDQADVLGLEVSGPGRIESGGGFAGGGTGLVGFAAGAAVAAVLNAATTRSSVQTFLRLQLRQGELFFQVTVAEPFELRITLSPVVTRIRVQGRPPT